MRFYFTLSDFNFDFKPNQSDRQSNVCEDQPRYSNSFRNAQTFNSNASMNGSSGATNNGNIRPQRPTTMTSSVNQSAQQFDRAANAFHNTGSAQNHIIQTPASPTITGHSSSASTSSLMKSSSHSIGENDAQNSLRTISPNGYQSPPPPPCIPTASTSTTTNKPACSQISQLSKMECCNDAGSGCECSDDELIAKFRETYGDQPLSPVTVDRLLSVENAVMRVPVENLTGSSTSSTKTGNLLGTPLREEASALESSDISSFEDLGAVGGSHMNNTIPSTSDTDKWQIINPTWNIDDTASTSSIVTDEKIESTNVSYATNLPNSITELPHNNASENQRQEQQQPQPTQNDCDIMTETFQEHSTTDEHTDLRSKLEKTLKSRQTHRKITRRQSDGIVYTASTSNSNLRSNRQFGFLDNLDDDEDDSSTSEDVSHKRSHKSCRKCGKTKGDLKKYIARFRHQLETTTAFSEIEIKQQLDAFLAFLESHSAFDSKDEGSTPNTELVQSPSQFVAENIELDEFDDDDYDDEAGIHVYGSNDDDTATSAHPPRQFFNLNSVDKK